jgi:hypothetical protein
MLYIFVQSSLLSSKATNQGELIQGVLSLVCFPCKKEGVGTMDQGYPLLLCQGTVPVRLPLSHMVVRLCLWLRRASAQPRAVAQSPQRRPASPPGWVRDRHVTIMVEYPWASAVSPDPHGSAPKFVDRTPRGGLRPPRMHTGPPKVGTRSLRKGSRSLTVGSRCTRTKNA